MFCSYAVPSITPAAAILLVLVYQFVFMIYLLIKLSLKLLFDPTTKIPNKIPRLDRAKDTSKYF
jgi:hypothetical protein